ncbi:MAG: enoyl-CoA hydratase-related protein [Firmicutes bacterium]|nr:enoyl-CoA hydratase-related protein [Bacillota bacterium]
MGYQELSWEQNGAVATITLNRPDALNALTETLRREMLEALHRCQTDQSVRVVVLKGAGRAFSVGQDLKEMLQYYESHGPALGQLVEDEYIPIVKALRAMEKPTIAVLEGAAVGGGMALALATDFRIISSRAQLVPGFVNVGLAPDTGTAFLLARSIGYARAVSLCLLGQPIKAAQMIEFGLAFTAHETPEALASELEQLTARLAAGPTRAYGAIRQLFDQAAHEPLATVLELERDVQDALAHTADHQEAVEAFLAKRTPVFRGE